MNLKNLTLYAIVGFVSSALSYYFIDRSIGRFLRDDVCIGLLRISSPSVAVEYGVPVVLFVIIFTLLVLLYRAIKPLVVSDKKSINST